MNGPKLAETARRAGRLGLLGIVLAAAGAGPATQPAIGPDEGRPHLSWEHADAVVGRVAFVSGRVVGVSHQGRANFLNFAEDRDKIEPPRRGFVAVVFNEYLAGFPDSLENLYAGKMVRVRGMVTTYRGRPEIQVRDPDQIAVLESPPETQIPAAPPLRTGEEVTVATYNVLNLFDELDDPYRQDETTPTKPREQMERLAAVIRKLDADVLALQEVENRFYLERFLEVFLPDMGYQHVVHFEGNDVRGIDVCLISRLPVGTVRSHRHVSFPDAGGRPMVFERDLLCATIEPPGGRSFEVWVVHFKSNYEGREYAEPIRLAEATKVRALLEGRLKEDPTARVILCGDFNDVWDSPTLRKIVGEGPTAMRCFADELPQERRVTYNQEPYRTMIDFILCSPALADRYVKGSYSVEPGSVETSGSDHNPVRATFRLK